MPHGSCIFRLLLASLPDRWILSHSSGLHRRSSACVVHSHHVHMIVGLAATAFGERAAPITASGQRHPLGTSLNPPADC